MKASIYLERATRGGLDGFIKDRLEVEKELFNELDVWEWFIMLFDAMSYCHFGPHQGEDAEKDWNKVQLTFVRRLRDDALTFACKIWHRDIKLANILVTDADPMPNGQTTRAYSRVFERSALQRCACLYRYRDAALYITRKALIKGSVLSEKISLTCASYSVHYVARRLWLCTAA